MPQTLDVRPAVRPAVALRSEARLVQDARRGDDGAFGELYSRYRPRIFAFILSRVHDHGRAEEIAQDVFMSALRQLRATDQEIVLQPWLYTIAKNACIDEFRRGTRGSAVPVGSDEDLSVGRGPMLSVVPTPDDAIESRQRLNDLRGAFGGLSDSHRQMLVMREFEGKSYDEIGERLGMSRQMVESGLFRARRKLGSEYDELATGRRCEQIVTAIGEGTFETVKGIGVKERRRAHRHLAHCESCRHHAMMANVDESLLKPQSIADKLAALLPIGFFQKLLPHGGGSGAAGGIKAAGAVGGASAGPVAAGGSISMGTAAVAAAVVAIAGAGGGVVLSQHHHSSPAPPATHVSHPAPAQGTPPVVKSDAGTGEHHHAAAGTGRHATSTSTRHHGANGSAHGRHGGKASKSHPGRSAGGHSNAGHKAAGGGHQAGGGSGRGSAGGGNGGKRTGGGGSSSGGGSNNGGGSSSAGSSSGGGGEHSGVGKTVQQTGNTVGKTVQQTGNTVGQTVQQTGNAVGNTVSNTGNTVGQTVQQTGNAVGNTVSNTGNTVGGVVNKVVPGAGAPVSGVTSGAGSTVSGVTSGVGSTVSQTGNTVGSTVGGVTSGVGSTVSQTGNTVGSTVGGVTGVVGGLVGGGK